MVDLNNRQVEAEKIKERILQDVAAYYHLVHDRSEDEFAPETEKIHYAGRVFDEKEMINLAEASLEFWLTAGHFTQEFEAKLASFLGVRYALFVNSGSSANLLAFAALTSPRLGDRAIQRGDEVITVAAGFPTTVAPIIQFGAVPVFVDVDLPSGNVDPALLEKAYSSKTKAIVLAHTLGNPFPVKEVKDFCDAHGLWLIEDNCDALGSQYEGKYTGSFGDIGTSSFYPPHHLTTGEGGAVYTNDPILKRILLSLRDWGRDCWCASGTDDTCGCRFSGQFGELPQGYDHKYVYSHFGYNLKATDLQASIGCAQIEKLPRFIEARRKNWQFLRSQLDSLSEYFILPEPEIHSVPAWFGFLLTVRENAPFTRNEIVRFLEVNQVQTRMLFAGNLIKHPCFDSLRNNGNGYRIAGDLVHTDQIMNCSFWIGVYPGMSEKMLDKMVLLIRNFVKENRR
ncbi:MAG: lipopolysaccharide biosynthesis protein RfbH [Planctomycetia bacterium]|nr:lipopolysaccharide biosynthesis protein RfbH [Planctomycetia bacterium]